MLLNQQGVSLVLGFLFIWLAVLTFFLVRAITHYRKLISGAQKGSLESVLEKILNEQGIASKRIDELVSRIEKAGEEGLLHVQKIGLVRFNPFSGTGGDQSFVLAVLDGRNSGFVISSLHTRDATRIYAKEVKEGKPVKYQLSKEESEAIQKARK